MWLFFTISAQHDYEAERRAREEKIGNLQEQANALKAQQTTTEHDLENFRAAVTKLKGEERQMQYVLSTGTHLYTLYTDAVCIEDRKHLYTMYLHLQISIHE